MPSKNFVPYKIMISEEHRRWIHEHPEIDIPKLLRSAILNQVRKSAQKNAAKSQEKISPTQRRQFP